MSFDFLIVDDSSTIRKLINKTLSMSDLELGEIREATNGQEALDQLAQKNVDIIFLDINMPIMSGIEFMKIFKDSEFKNRAKVIIVSTEGSETRFDILRKMGIYAQVRKPFQPESLIQTLSSVLKGDQQ